MPFILVIVALLLIFLEFFLPGGVMGTAGAIMLIGGVALYISDSDSLLMSTLFFMGSSVALVAVIKLALNRIQAGSPENSVYHSGDQEGYFASSFDSELLGEKGIAESDLKPSGHARIRDKRVQVISKLGYVKKGKEIKVIGGEGAHFFVKPTK